MTVLVPHETDGYIHFDLAECKAAAEPLAQTYQQAQPYPHIVLDDFLPVDFLRGLLAEFPDTTGHTYFDRSQERLKFQFAPPSIAGRRIRNLVTELNGPEMLGFLETLTGISNLIPDPYFEGGGLHETRRGGHLSIHADFNLHRGLQCERRINLLIYLNEGWSPEFGGDLELWDREMKSCHQRIAPIIGRAVIFNTKLDSFHGHPEPLACPPDRARRSIATYYYTANPEGLAALPERTTVFKQRPASGDKPDRRIQFEHFLRDWAPPKLYRFVKRLNRFR